MEYRDTMRYIGAFKHQYQAEIRISERRLRIPSRTSFDFENKTFDQPFVSFHYEEVDAIEIFMPEQNFQKLLESQETFLYQKDQQEKFLRERYPSLKNAWEQYQMILSLVNDERTL